MSFVYKVLQVFYKVIIILTTKLITIPKHLPNTIYINNYFSFYNLIVQTLINLFEI
jgi:hypothetical protein